MIYQNITFYAEDINVYIPILPDYNLVFKLTVFLSNGQKISTTLVVVIDKNNILASNLWYLHGI